jgi:hypothetical protein
MEPIKIIFSRPKPALSKNNTEQSALDDIRRAASGIHARLLKDLVAPIDQDEAWRRATLTLSEYQHEEYFEAACSAASKICSLELGVDKRQLPLAMMACALIAPDRSQRADRIERVISDYDLWQTYPTSNSESDMSFRQNAGVLLTSKILKGTTGYRDSKLATAQAISRIAGTQHELGWRKIGSSAGNRMHDSSNFNASRISKDSFDKLPSAFWLAAQRRMSSVSVSWRRIDAGLIERAATEPSLPLELWGSALISLDADAVSRCQKKYPDSSSDQRMAIILNHFDHEPEFESDLFRRINASQSAKRALLAGSPDTKGSPQESWMKLAHWPGGLKRAQAQAFFEHFEREAKAIIDRREQRFAKSVEFAKPIDSNPPSGPHHFMPEMSTLSLAQTSIIRAGTVLEPITLASLRARRLELDESSDKTMAPIDPWAASIDAIAKHANSSGFTETENAFSYNRVPESPVAWPVGRSNAPHGMIDLGNGRLLHIEKATQALAMKNTREQSLLDFSAHMRAQAFSLRKGPKAKKLKQS